MISLRKINVLLVIIIIVMLLHHALLILLGFIGVISYTPDFKSTGWHLLYPLMAHIIISLYLYLSNKRKKIKTYSKLVSDTTYQYVSGICIILFVILHIIFHLIFPLSDLSNLNKLLIHFTIDSLLFISIAIHLNISIPKFLISLGFLENKNKYKYAKKITKFIMLIILIILILGELKFYFGGIL